MEMVDRMTHGQAQRQQADTRADEEVSLSKQIDYMLTEARTILPGARKPSSDFSSSPF